MGIIVDLSLTVFISLGAPILIVQKQKQNGKLPGNITQD